MQIKYFNLFSTKYRYSFSILFLSAFFVFFNAGFIANAQTGQIKGIIIDEKTKKPIEFMPVRLYDGTDSVIVNDYFTNAEGKFEITDLPLKSYYIVIRTYFNYNAKYIHDLILTRENTKIDLGKILLMPNDAEDLDEIVVRHEKVLIENNFDKKIYNVEDDAATKGGTVSDVLNNIPSVEVDQDGKVSLRGDGNVTILIDGRPSTLAGTNGKSLFDALPAGSVERIEIINNPSAKYDPDGTSGIINIVLKKNKLRGINGNVSLSAGTGNTYNGSASVSFRNSKMNAFATYAFRYYEGQRGNQIRLRRQYEDSLLSRIQDRTGGDRMINHTVRIGSDFTLKPRNTFGFVVTGNMGDRKRTGDLNNVQYSDETEVRRWERFSTDPSKDNALDLNLNYKLDFKEEKGNIVFDLSQSFHTDAAKGDYRERSITDYGIPSILPDLYQRIENTDKSRYTTGQVDYTRKLNEKMTLDIGTKGIFKNSDMNSGSQTRNTSGEYETDTLSTYRYKYGEQIVSLYGNFSHKLDKFKYQGGLRAESAMQAPDLVSQGISLKKHYLNIYPSAYVGYELNTKSELSLSFSRRINRPQSDQLNPFTSYADPLNLRSGNPYLTPEYINSFELGYNLDLKVVNIAANAFYRQTKDMIQRIILFHDNGVSVATQANIDKSNSYGAELVLVYKPVNWLRNVVSLNGNFIEYIDNTQSYNWNNSGFNWGFKYAGTAEFWKKTANVQLNARYRGKIITAQGTARPRLVIDLAGQKKLKGDNWTVGFRITDVFNMQEFVIEVDQPGIYQYSRFKQNTRRFYLTLSYKFGKYDVSRKSKITNQGGGEDF